MGPDGAVKLEPVREMPVDPPRICGAGPCRHYHQFRVQLDAQNPMDERKPDGTVIHHGRVFHVQTHHYCYPDVGIELELGALPVLSCNHWVPIAGLLRTKRGIRRRFERDLATWQAEQQMAIDDAVIHAALLAEDVAINLTVHVARLDGRIVSGTIEALPSWSLRKAVVKSLVALDQRPAIGDDPSDDFAVSIVASDDPEDWKPPGYVEPLANLEATLDMIELEDGARLLVTIIPKETP